MCSCVCVYIFLPGVVKYRASISRSVEVFYRAGVLIWNIHKVSLYHIIHTTLEKGGFLKLAKEICLILFITLLHLQESYLGASYLSLPQFLQWKMKVTTATQLTGLLWTQAKLTAVHWLEEWARHTSAFRVVTVTTTTTTTFESTSKRS